MRDSDDVFFFTLIDFLLQAFFFGLLLFVVAKAADVEKAKKSGMEAAQIEELKKAAGVSNIAELTDMLTRLVPVRNLQGIADFMSNAGGLDSAKSVSNFVAENGGIEKVREGLVRLRKLEEGSGKPPCQPETVNGRRQFKSTATVYASDTVIRFEQPTEELKEVLTLIGRSYDSVRELSLTDFRTTFGRLTTLKPECRFALSIVETTRFVDGRDAVTSAFYPASLRRQ